MIPSSSFSIAANGSETVHLHLTAKSKGLLPKAGKHGPRATLDGSRVKERTLLVKSASRNAKRRHDGAAPSSIAGGHREGSSDQHQTHLSTYAAVECSPCSQP